MALFTGAVRKTHTRPKMAQPEYADGPWGSAIQYWLNRLKWRQSDLARATGIEPKTISSIVRGFDTTTRMLRRIWDALLKEGQRRSPLNHLYFEEVLVSPEAKSEAEKKRLWIQEITEKVARELEGRSTLPLGLPPTPSPPHPPDHPPTIKDVVGALDKIGQQQLAPPTRQRAPRGTPRTKSARKFRGR